MDLAECGHGTVPHPGAGCRKDPPTEPSLRLVGFLLVEGAQLGRGILFVYSARPQALIVKLIILLNNNTLLFWSLQGPAFILLVGLFPLSLLPTPFHFPTMADIQFCSVRFCLPAFCKWCILPWAGVFLLRMNGVGLACVFSYLFHLVFCF